MQDVEISKFVLVLCFVNIIVAFSNPVSSDVINLNNVCCTECNCNVTESGRCSLQFQQECSDGTCIHLNFKNETSIIELVASVELQNITSLTTESGPVTATDVGIELDISEFDTDAKKYVLLETRYMQVNESEPWIETYLTRTSTARVCLSSTTGWSYYSVELSFKEVEYRRDVRVEDPSDESGEILGKYQPNSVRLWQLPKDPNKNWRGIEITIQHLEIDTEKGEYLLIGAGSPKDFPPRFVTQITENSSFYIANASAYIEVVSGSTVRKEKPFKILWNRKDAEIPPTINPADILNSVLICFYNYGETEKASEGKTIDEMFPGFREKFAESARKYLKENKKKDADCLDKSSIRVIGYSNSSNAVSVLITLVCEERIFRYKELKDITDYFQDHEKSHALGYKVMRCPDVDQDLPYKEKWSILIYALVPAFALFILIVWAWKKNIFSQQCAPEMEKKITLGLESNSVPVEPNMYERTIPKILLVDGQGRRQTLIQGFSQDTERRDSEDETVVEMNAIPSTSRESDSLTHVLTNRKGKRRPSIQALMPKNEEKESDGKSDIRKTEGEECEHLYDSVCSSIQMNETRL